MSNVLITGARGFIGKHLSRHLAAMGHRVSGIGHGIWPESEASVWGMSHWINGDITPGNLRVLQQAGGTPEVVFHLAGGASVGAAIASPREDFFRTVATTAELLEWLRQDAPGARLVAVSSAAVYGAGHDGQIAEDARLAPFSPYGHHKLLMEQLCRSYAACFAQPVVVARLFSVFGPELKKQLLWDTCVRLARTPDTLELGGTGNELRDWTEVHDVARALGQLASVASTDVEVFNVGRGVGISVAKIASMLIDNWPELHALKPTFSAISRPGDPFSLVANPQRLIATGFEWQVPVEAGLSDYVRWFRRQWGSAA